MENERLKKYYTIICDAWAFMKKYQNTSCEDGYWHEVVMKAEEFYENHGKCEFAKKMIFAVIEELDAVARGVEE